MVICRWILFVAGIFSAAFANADVSPVGRWRVVSDQTNEPVAIMKITEENGEYRGMIEEILPSAGKPVNPVCNNCEGSLKGQPIQGLVIMQGLKRDGDQFTGGHILDPDSGHYYRVKLRVGPDGRTLRVRGYLGLSLLGRTQTWYRIE